MMGDGGQKKICKNDRGREMEVKREELGTERGGGIQSAWRKTKLTQPLTSNSELWLSVNFVLSQRREAGDLEEEEKTEEEGVQKELMEGRQK